MAKIIEFRTINVAVPSWKDAAPKYEALGLSHAPPHDFSGPPAQIIDVAFRFPWGGGGIHLVEPTDPSSPVARFMDRRGPGLFSLTFRVDDLREAMDEWGAAGLEWLRDDPVVFENASVPPYRVERFLMNWIKPGSTGGVLLEITQFEGRVEEEP